MDEVILKYGFLFALGILWSIFAAIQDFRKREISNWLNFSLIGFALAYKAFYSLTGWDYRFFIFGILGFAIFFILSYAFYYSRVFAGGDAKLLMGFGALLPFENMDGLLFNSLAFLLVLFLIGALYSLVYSAFIVRNSYERFVKEYKIFWMKGRYIVLLGIVIAVILLFVSKFSSFSFWVSLFLVFTVFLYSYLMALDKCMIKLVNPGKLTEGDWLERDVRIDGKVIKKNVHGLSFEEIKLLRRHNKSVYIKEGIPFAPVFLITLLFMVFFYLFLSERVSDLFSLLS